MFGGDGVDSHPCDHAGVEHTNDLFAGGVLLFGRAAVFEVDNDGVSLGFEGFFKNFFGGVGAHEEPGTREAGAQLTCALVAVEFKHGV